MPFARHFSFRPCTSNAIVRLISYDPLLGTRRAAPRPLMLSMRPSSTTLALLLAVCAAASWAQSSPNVARLYEDALTRHEKKDFAGAIVQLKNVLKADSKNLSAHALLGRALLADGQLVAAEVSLTEALSLGVNRAEVVLALAETVVAQGRPQQLLDEPRFSPAGLAPRLQTQLLLMKAAAQMDVGDPKAAAKSIEDARALEPSTPGSWLAEVPLRLRGGQPKEALAAAEKAISLAPDSAEGHHLRASVLHFMRDPRASAAYDQALKLQPTHTEALVARAGLLIDSQKYSDARRDVEVLLRNSPREPRGHYLLSLLAGQQKDLTLQRKSLNEVTSLLDPLPLAALRYRPQLLILGGLSHHGLGQFEKAKPYLEAALRAQPNSPVSKLLAQIYLADKNVDRAIESLEQYLRSYPNDNQALQLLASAHMSEGRYTRSTKLLQDALRAQDQPDLRTMLGASLVGGNRAADGVAEFQAALKRNPNHLAAATSLALIYLQSEQPAKALPMVELVLKQRPKDAGILNLAGSVYAAIGDPVRARSSLQAALAADPSFTSPQVQLARLDAAEKEYTKASARLEAVLRKDEKNVEALMELSQLAEIVGRLADAQRSLEKADDYSGIQSYSAGIKLVDFHLRYRRPDLAAEALKRVTSKAPEVPAVLLAAASVALANGDAKGASAHLARVASAANNNPTLLVRVALMQQQANNVVGAVYSAEKALEARPNFAPAMALLSELEMRRGDLQKAEKLARQLVAANPRSGVGHALLGEIAVARKLPATQALDLFRRAHQVDNTTDSLLRLVRAQALSDEPAAVKLAEQWLKAHPNDARVARTVAEGMTRAGKFSAARTAFETVLRLDPEDAEALNNLAHVQLEIGDLAGAQRSAEAALQKRPGVPHILGTAGWVAFKAGQADRGLQLLREARLRDPSNLDTRYFLANVLASTGRVVEARSELDAVSSDGRPFRSQALAQQLRAALK